MSTNPTTRTRKIRFIVLDENVFGCVYPQTPLSLQILGSSILRGASVTWVDGVCSLPLDPEWVRSPDCPKPLDLARVREGRQQVRLNSKRVRPATRADFEFFRLVYTGYEKDPAYDFPAE